MATVSEAPPTRPGRVPLAALLAGILFTELWCNRIGARLLRLDPAHGLHRTAQGFDTAALFLFELASVLGATLFAGALVVLVRSPHQRRPLRVTAATVGAVAVALASLGVFVHLSARLQAHLYLSAIFLTAVLALGALTVRAPVRVRLGIVLFAVPIGLMLGANLAQRFSAPGVLDPTASRLAEAAGAALVMAGLASPWLLVTGSGGGAIAVALGSLVTGTGLALGKLEPGLAARLAGLGLGVSIPIAPLWLPIYVLGAGALAFSIGALLVRPGPERLRATGLLLIGSVGLQLELPYQIAGSLIGLICLLESVARPSARAITREALDARLRAWAARIGATQVLVTGDPGAERARLTFTAAGDVPGTLLVERAGGAIDRYEISVGEVPPRRPPLTIAARSSPRRYGRPAAGPAVVTDDAAFDRRYLVRDARGVGTVLFEADVRAALAARLGDGWIGVWPQRGAQFAGGALPDGAEAGEGLAVLVDLLLQLRARAGA